MITEIQVRPLSPTLVQDYLSFFDGPAFEDNPHWASCYCFYHHNPEPEDWESRTAKENRNASTDLIRAGRIEGFLAYRAGLPVGWCKAAPRLTIPALSFNPELAVDDADAVGSIVCFIVTKEHRHAGVAAALLRAACASFAARSLRIAEAYPRIAMQDDASNFRGPLRMYTSHGFEIYRELNGLSIVRKAL